MSKGQVKKVSYKLWVKNSEGKQETIRYNTFKQLQVGIKQHIDQRKKFEVVITYLTQIQYFKPFDMDFQLWSFDGERNHAASFKIHRDIKPFKRNYRCLNKLRNILLYYGV